MSQKSQIQIKRNPGMPLELEWIKSVQVNTSAVERRTSSLLKRRTVKKKWQAAWLLKAISLIDLTTLAGDDTPGRVYRLCAKAKHPVRDEQQNLKVKEFTQIGKTVNVIAEGKFVANSSVFLSGIIEKKFSSKLPEGQGNVKFGVPYGKKKNI